MRIRSRLLTALLVRLGVWALRGLFLTCRKQFHPDVPGTNAYAPPGAERYLYCVWHDQIVATIFSARPRAMSGLVSRHQDGGYVAEVMRMAGVRPIRGSTRRGGAEAMRQLIEAAENLHVTITPDGPRGPRRQIKPGILFLAAQSGRGIVPTAYACGSCWRIRGNWTDMMIPKPFTRIVVRGGPPLYIPQGTRREDLEGYAERLRAEMLRLEREAERRARGEPPPTEERRAAA